MVPYADFNLLTFPDKDQAMEKILDLTMLTDILPTGFHGAVMAGVTAGSVVYRRGRASRSSVCIKLSIIRCCCCHSRRS